MTRWLTAAALVLTLGVSSVHASEITGRYVEARTCDVWTGPCFANADHNLSGKNAVLAWKIDQGTFENVRLDGLGVVAVLSASNTLGLEQSGPATTALIIDRRATDAQRDALVKFVRRQGGKLLQNIVAVERADVRLDVCECKNESCAEVKAGQATIKTRCIDAEHDKACGNETAFYPPLTRGVQARPAAATEAGYGGRSLPNTWREFDRRGAYVGTFQVRD
jgi:hypothetical protein